MTSGEARYRALVEEIRTEFPRFRVVRKDGSRFHRAIHISLAAITLGGMRSYLGGYVTTMGQGIYVPPDWDARDPDDRYVTLRHERVHMRQFRRLTFPGMALVYLLVPVPVGLAYARARLEWAGYRESVRATAEVRGLEAVRDPALRARIVRQFTGPAYAWMWPFPRVVGRWYDAAVAELAEAT